MVEMGRSGLQQQHFRSGCLHGISRYGQGVAGPDRHHGGVGAGEIQVQLPPCDEDQDGGDCDGPR